MNGVAALITALVPLLGLGGGAVAWFLRRIDKRVAAAEQSVKDCEQHRQDDQDKIARLTFEFRRDGIAIRMLCNELHQVDPGNSTLSNVAAVLRQAYDPVLSIDEDMTDLLARIEMGDRKP